MNDLMATNQPYIHNMTFRICDLDNGQIITLSMSSIPLLFDRGCPSLVHTILYISGGFPWYDMRQDRCLFPSKCSSATDVVYVS